MASSRSALSSYQRPRDFISLTGPDAEAYLQGQCSQDVVALGLGQCADALLLEPNGKLSALIRVTRTNEEQFVVDVDGGFRETVLARLGRFKLRTKVEIAPLDWRCLALRGTSLTSVADVSALGVAATNPSPESGPLYLPVDWNGWSGYDLVGADPVVAEDVPHIDASTWEMWRIESGLPVMGRELDDATVPAEAHLLDGAVSFTKGCYTGQELVGRLDARGNNVPRRLMGLVAVSGEVSVGDELEQAGARSCVTSADL